MISHVVCRQFADDLLDGLHRPSDEYRLALYTEDATLDASTTMYTPKHETSGPGYSAGGVVLRRVRSRTADGAHLGFADVVLLNTEIAARGALVYNKTRENRALFVLDFGKVYRSTAGEFEIQLPPTLCTVR